MVAEAWKWLQVRQRHACVQRKEGLSCKALWSGLPIVEDDVGWSLQMLEGKESCKLAECKRRLRSTPNLTLTLILTQSVFDENAVTRRSSKHCSQSSESQQWIVPTFTGPPVKRSCKPSSVARFLQDVRIIYIFNNIWKVDSGIWNVG